MSKFSKYPYYFFKKYKKKFKDSNMGILFYIDNTAFWRRKNADGHKVQSMLVKDSILINNQYAENFPKKCMLTQATKKVLQRSSRNNGEKIQRDLLKTTSLEP
jgi:hypothetical protein